MEPMISTTVMNRTVTEAELHARKVDDLRDQCSTCKLNRPGTPTKDCAVRIKLVVDDSPVGWKHEDLFLDHGRCKMRKEK